MAWVETTAMNYHDDSGEIFNKIKLQVYTYFSYLDEQKKKEMPLLSPAVHGSIISYMYF